MNNQLLITKYILFSTIATILNLVVQRTVLTITLNQFKFLIAIVLGTLVGLIVKYILDKKWIFYYKTKAFTKDTRTFVKYTLVGLITTTIFWTFETTFWLFYRDDFMRELGAVIGLSIGYYIKYQIDKRYVFT